MVSKSSSACPKGRYVLRDFILPEYTYLAVYRNTRSTSGSCKTFATLGKCGGVRTPASMESTPILAALTSPLGRRSDPHGGSCKMGTSHCDLDSSAARWDCLAAMPGRGSSQNSRRLLPLIEKYLYYISKLNKVKKKSC